MAEAREAGVLVAREGSDGTYVYAVDAAGNRSGGVRTGVCPWCGVCLRCDHAASSPDGGKAHMAKHSVRPPLDAAHPEVE